MTMYTGMEVRKRIFIECLWDCKLVDLFWKSSWGFLQENNTRIIIWPSYTTTWHIPKGLRSYCSILAYPYFFAMAKKWNQPRFPSTTEEIMKMCYLCTMKYFSSIKEMKSGSLLVFIFQFQELENGYAEWGYLGPQI